MRLPSSVLGATRTGLVVLALSASTLLAGCSEIQDAASESAGNAACSVAQSAVDGVAGQVESIADDIGADPAAAERELSGLRDTLAAAENGLSGEAQTRIADARAALGDLADQARQAADGVQVDTSAVDRAQRSLSDAVADLRDIC